MVNRSTLPAGRARQERAFGDTDMNLKQQAAHRALGYVGDGMVLGLGTGSTNAYFLDMLGERLQSGALRDIVGVPTSEGTAARARELGIPLSTLADHPRLDLVVDGADEVDPELQPHQGTWPGLAPGKDRRDPRRSLCGRRG